jgi:hypothetical protein
MQLSLELPELVAPALGWQGLDPDQRAEAVSTLARLMAKALNPQPREETNDERQL